MKHRELGAVTGNPKYAYLTNQIYEALDKNTRNHGLLPEIISLPLPLVNLFFLYSLFACEWCCVKQALQHLWMFGQLLRIPAKRMDPVQKKGPTASIPLQRGDRGSNPAIVDEEQTKWMAILGRTDEEASYSFNANPNLLCSRNDVFRPLSFQQSIGLPAADESAKRARCTIRSVHLLHDVQQYYVRPSSRVVLL